MQATPFTTPFLLAVGQHLSVTVRGRASETMLNFLKSSGWYCGIALTGTEIGIRRGILLTRKMPLVGDTGFVLSWSAAGNLSRVQNGNLFYTLGSLWWNHHYKNLEGSSCN